MQEIKDMYLSDVSKVVVKPVVFSSSKVEDKSSSEKTSTTTIPTTSVKEVSAASLADHGNPTWIAAQAGFEIGQTVIEKGQETQHAESLFGIVKIDESSDVTLAQLCSYAGKPIRVSVPLERLLSHWAVSKSEAPIEMSSTLKRPNSLYIDDLKATVFRAIVAADTAYAPPPESLAIWRRPDEVRTKRQFKKGELTLVPVARLSNISTVNSSTSAPSVGKHTVLNVDEKVELFVVPPTKPPIKLGETVFDKDVLVGFYWWVTTVSSEEKANMQASHVTQGKIRIPVLVNSKPVEKFEKLEVYKPKPTAVPLQGATVISAEPAAPPDAVAKKKRRKK